VASKTIILDDLDGKTEGAETTRITIRVGVDEQAVDIDLAKPNQDKLMQLLKPYFDAGREVTRKSGGSDSETTRARAWLLQHGHKVGEKGRIPDDLMAIYRANAGSLQVRLWALGLRGAKPFHFVCEQGGIEIFSGIRYRRPVR
jgi:nucleoid-associated protein Lsr2